MADALTRTDHLIASDEPDLVRSPAARYVFVTGAGAPGDDEYYRKKALVVDVARALAPATSPDASEPVAEGQLGRRREGSRETWIPLGQGSIRGHGTRKAVPARP